MFRKDSLWKWGLDGRGERWGCLFGFYPITSNDARNVNTFPQMYPSTAAGNAPRGARVLTSGFKAVNIFTLTRFLPHYFPKGIFSFTFTFPQCNLHFHNHFRGLHPHWYLKLFDNCQSDKHEMVFFCDFCISLTTCPFKNLSYVHWPFS